MTQQDNQTKCEACDKLRAENERLRKLFFKVDDKLDEFIERLERMEREVL